VATLFELIEIELTRVRRMAEQENDGFLLYLIDMAILEANSKARARNDSLETLADGEGSRVALNVVG